jgi:hypothetical protein
MTVGGTPYYYYEGVYMQPQGEDQVVVVPAPTGAEISTLPSGAAEVTAGGVKYYYVNGVFYSQSGGKYVVVPAPAGAVVPMVPQDAQDVVVGEETFKEFNGVRYMPAMADGRTVYVVQ